MKSFKDLVQVLVDRLAEEVGSDPRRALATIGILSVGFVIAFV